MQNAWWKTNVALEAMALIRGAYSDLNGDAVPPALEPCAMEHAPGALFIAMKDAPADAKKSSPADIAHRMLEKVKDEPAANSLGIHLMRVLPVEDSCSLEVAQIEETAKKLASTYLPDSASPIRFAVRPEPHSARLPGGTNVGDLVRRVADCVPKTHTVDLNKPELVILLILAGVRIDACSQHGSCTEAARLAGHRHDERRTRLARAAPLQHSGGAQGDRRRSLKMPRIIAWRA